VTELALEAVEDPCVALAVLADAGIAVRRASDLVPRNKVTQARRALGLNQPAGARSIESLAFTAGISVEEVTARLGAARIVRDPRQRAVPRSKLYEARRALGIGAVEAPAPVAELPPPPPIEPAAAEAVATGTKKQRKKTKKAVRWHSVGKEEPIFYLSEGEVTQIHYTLVEDFRRSRDPIEPAGVRDEHLLGSALTRPLTSLGGTLKYPKPGDGGGRDVPLARP
jgi:hypothetical protein